MNPIKLTGVRPDGKEVSVSACGVCGTVHPNEPAAVACCAPNLCACGQVLEGGWPRECDACRSKAMEARRLAVYEEAKKVAWTEYDGAWLSLPDSDRYFPDLDSLLDHFDGEPVENIPTWAFGCTSRKFSMDAQGILENQLEDWFEEATEHIPDLAELQAALDKVAEQIPDCYETDHSTVVTFEAESKAFAEKQGAPVEAETAPAEVGK